MVVILNTFNEAIALPARADVLKRGLGRTRRYFVLLGATCVFVEGELSACCVGSLFGWIGDIVVVLEITALAFTGSVEENPPCVLCQSILHGMDGVVVCFC